MSYFNLNGVHPSWKSCIQAALHAMDPVYLKHLSQDITWLPGPEKIFSAFSIPVSEVRYVLFGESPYPRRQSANGYAFWDANVGDIWSHGGLSKTVNRATSLRNFIKMLLVAEELLTPNATSQEHIDQVDKSRLVKTNSALFTNLLNHGFLLLNASLVLQTTAVAKDAKAWQPFMLTVLDFLGKLRPSPYFILFGNLAKKIEPLIKQYNVEKLYAEHPYNHTFITNKEVIQFFQPLHLLINAGEVSKN